MTYEEIIKDELDHFYREKEFIKEEKLRDLDFN